MSQDIEALQAALREFAREREWGQFHSPKNLADVLIYVLQLADKVGIYPMDAAWRKMVPPSLTLAEAHADLAALDQLRPRLMRLQRLTERANDTDTALGSDVMRCALDGYALLKVSGRNQGLEGLRRDLGTRFSKAPRVVEVGGVPEVEVA